MNDGERQVWDEMQRDACPGDDEPRTVSVLCAAPKSVYFSIPGCDVFDKRRDVRTFKMDKPCVGHPPCRLWSAYCSHQAKSEDPEMERGLGIFCASAVRLCGGVLEQPAHSRLWDAAKLPKPGLSVNFEKHGFSMELPQFWFGDSREKNTWLWFFGINPMDLPEMPFRLKPEGGDRRIWQLMSSRNARERTPKPFAEWLVECARRTKV